METTTKQFRKRNAILNYLRCTDTHPSAEMVYSHLKQEYPDISLGTVYRNLAMFKDKGEIMSLGTVNGVERFDGNTAPHVHFICTECGKVDDLHTISVPEELKNTAAQSCGGRIDGCQLLFTGICAECANK